MPDLILSPIASKTCTKCGVTKAIELFHHHDKSKGTRRPDCKACKRLVAAKWQKVNRVEVNAANAAWSERNKEQERLRKSTWAAANIEKARAAEARWREANPEKRKLICRQSNQNRRAKKKVGGGRLSAGIVERLKALQKGKCACCGAPLENDFHLDHIMPLALGGKNEDGNVQLLTSTCNQQKHAKHPVDFMQERGFLL